MILMPVGMGCGIYCNAMHGNTIIFCIMDLKFIKNYNAIFSVQVYICYYCKILNANNTIIYALDV